MLTPGIKKPMMPLIPPAQYHILSEFQDEISKLYLIILKNFSCYCL